MRANREELLSALQSMQAGLADKEIMHQSTSFVFKDGFIYTFNEEVACRIKSPIDFEGAVSARPLVKLLETIKDESVAVSRKKEKMVIDGKWKQGHVKMDAEIKLPLDKIKFPKSSAYSSLSEDFADAITLTQDSASKDKQKAQLVCIHITPKWMEAFDNFQMTRFMLDTKLPKSVLITAMAARNIPVFGMTEYAQNGDGWMHFRNADKLCLSCVLTPAEGYKDLTPFFKIEGSPIKLPKNLADAVKPAQNFSEENKDSKGYILVEVKQGRIRITGTGVTGGYWEIREIKYKGKDIAFMISPNLLIELAHKYNECFITKKSLVVDGGKFRYMTRLVQPEEGQREVKQQSDEVNEEIKSRLDKVQKNK